MYLAIIVQLSVIEINRVYTLCATHVYFRERIFKRIQF